MMAECLAFVRVRRAILDVIAEGDAYALTIHDRLRWTRGFAVDDLPSLMRELHALEVEGLVASRLAAPDARMQLHRPRRVFVLTPAGMRERERLVIP